MSENLQIEFNHLFEKYSNDLDLLGVYWIEIEKAYHAKKRHYHNLTHVQLDNPSVVHYITFL